MIVTFVMVFSVGFAGGFAVAATMAARDFKKLRDMMDVSNAGGQIPPVSGGNLDRLVGLSESKGG